MVRWKWWLKKHCRLRLDFVQVYETVWISPGLCFHCWGFAQFWPTAPDKRYVIILLQWDPSLYCKKKIKGFFISIPFIFCRVAKMRKTVKLHLFFLKHVLFGALVVLTWHLCLFQLSPLGRIIHVSAFFGNGLHPPLQEDVLLFNELLIRGFRSAPSAPSQEGTLISYGFSFGSFCK